MRMVGPHKKLNKRADCAGSFAVVEDDKQIGEPSERERARFVLQARRRRNGLPDDLMGPGFAEWTPVEEERDVGLHEKL